MRKMTRRAFGAAGFALAFAATASLAQQQPQTTRIRAMIEKVDGDVLMVKARNADGSFGAAALNYGRDGIVPPM